MKEALIVATSYLIKELPITQQSVFDAKYLHPKLQHKKKKNAPAAIKRLTRSIVMSLPIEAVKKEFKVKESNVDSIVDTIASEFCNYQMEVIPESFYMLQKDKSPKGREQISYWKYAYGIAEVQQADANNDTECCYDRIDNYWEKV